MVLGVPDIPKSDKADSVLRQGMALIEAGKADKAEILAQTRLAAEKSDRHALWLMAFIALRVRLQPKQALAWLVRISKLNDDVEACLLEAQALFADERYDLAEACYRRLLKINPTLAAAQIGMSWVIFKRDPEKAARFAALSIKQQPEKALLLNAAKIFSAAKYYDSAVRLLQGFSKEYLKNLGKEFVLINYFRCGRLLWIENSLQESLKCFERFWQELTPIWHPVDAVSLSSPPPRYSRSRPGPRYRDLAQQYQQMHLLAKTSPERASNFAGSRMSFIYGPLIRDFLMAIDATDILDYGGGRGVQYRAIPQASGRDFPGLAAYFGIERASCFDAGWPDECPYPAGLRFDAVISCDVLEHIDRADIPWVVDELFGFARKGVFVTIGSYLAGKILPNGENAHCTIEFANWWRPIFADAAQRHPGIRYRVLIARRYEICNAADIESFEKNA